MNMTEVSFLYRENFEPYQGEERRTKRDYPYSYHPLVSWRVSKEEVATATGSPYSDRIYGWNPQKHDELCQTHFGNTRQDWYDRAPEQIEAFLRDYFDAPDLVLLQVMEHCNWANGYPCWQFFYKTASK